MRSLFVLLLLGVLLGTVAIVVRSGVYARENPGKPINSAMRLALDRGPRELSAEDAALIAQKYPAAQKTESGLRYIVQVPGEGEPPAAGARVTVQYEGRLLDGTKFDSTYDRKEPFTFTVGVGKVVRGWDEAFSEMRKGEKRTLIIPYWLGYGDKRVGLIPPRATLVFDVELLSFK
jgi:FKBP-type peptidyl-prolyl cis-trans isomerase